MTGKNANYQLGFECTEEREDGSPCQSRFREVEGLLRGQTVDKVACGGSHTVVSTSGRSRQLFHWGCPVCGQLGLMCSHHKEPKPFPEFEGKVVVQVVCATKGAPREFVNH